MQQERGGQKPSLVERELIEPEVIIESVMTLLHLDEDRRNEVKAVLFTKKMPGEGSEGLRNFFEDHHFGVSEEKIKRETEEAEEKIFFYQGEEILLSAAEVSHLEDFLMIQEKEEGESDINKAIELVLEKREVEELSKQEASEDFYAGIEADDTIGLYFRDMAQYPLLTYQEEVFCGALCLIERNVTEENVGDLYAQLGINKQDIPNLYQWIQAKKEATKQRLIEGNTRLVVAVAKKYRNSGVPFLDLIQEGNLGLIQHAIEKFDFRRGNRFSTYAFWWIKQAVSRSLPSQGMTVRLPPQMYAQVRRLARITQRLQKSLGKEQPSEQEIAEAMGISAQKVKTLRQASKDIISLEAPVGEDEESELGDFIEDESMDSPEEAAINGSLAESLEEVLETLTPRQAKILQLRFGLNGEDRSYTLKEVGDRYGLTRERVRQIQNEALNRLRHPRRARLLRNYMYEER